MKTDCKSEYWCSYSTLIIVSVATNEPGSESPPAAGAAHAQEEDHQEEGTARQALGQGQVPGLQEVPTTPLRSIVNQNENQAILRLEGVRDRKDTDWYFGKRVVYVAKHGSKNFKTIWGKIAKSHGNGGAVLARFAHNLPPKAIGSTLRVMLFPQRHA